MARWVSAMCGAIVVSACTRVAPAPTVTLAVPDRASEDKWVLDGCPENGPAIAAGPQGRIHLVWPTLVSGSTPGSEPTLALFYSTSNDRVRFAERQRLTTEGTPGHVQIAVNAADGALMVVWDELKGAYGARSPPVAFLMRRGRCGSFANGCRLLLRLIPWWRRLAEDSCAAGPTPVGSHP